MKTGFRKQTHSGVRGPAGRSLSMADTSPIKVEISSDRSNTKASGSATSNGSKKHHVTPPVEGLKTAHADLISWLYATHGPFLDGQFSLLEQTTGLKREQLSYVFGGLWIIYLVLGGAAQFVSNLIGFAYPAYASVKAVRTEGKDDDSQWLMYWTVFASFFLVDALTSGVVSWFPFYFLLKSAFLVFLWLPQTHGAEYLYETVVDPAVTFIDKCIQQYA